MVRVRRSALERAALVDAWRESGLSVPAFCASRGLNPKTVAGWIYKPAHKAAIDRARRQADPDDAPPGGRPAPASAPAFVPIEVAESSFPARGRERSGVEIRLRIRPAGRREPRVR
jgi:hypothetical protein